ncbi:porin [Prosthecomicrobium pneumaticum]|uniref:Porin n=1 Tax=Prosthecomicrobium pneumaticum TaxID=81895 RepID=A0A7W9L3P0_9HYPH|nr:porin [Prosthecomicrobium pneumaticum]MBB5754734.1 hypothetical protein [Prosthecomicrobium pneumaticum]
MNIKTLLLGSAAALMVAGGAQAADLTVAEPVDYVKVCDAFGAGYWYAPGTDTCIKIGGFVRFSVNFGDDVDSNIGNDYQFRTRSSLQVTASSMTEYGPLTAFIDYRADSYGSQDGSTYLDSGWVQLGPIQAGKFTSAFDFGGGYTDDGGFRSDETTDHVALTYAMNGFGIILSVEDPQDRTEENTVVSLPFPPYSFVNMSGSEEDFPDLVAALTYSSGIFSGKLSAAYTDGAYDGDQGWAVQAGLEIAMDSFSAGDKFKILAAYADGAPSFTGAVNTGVVGGNWSGESWNVLASYIHFWAPNLNSSITGSYVEYDSAVADAFDVEAWKVAFDTAYKPVNNLTLLGEVGYQEINQDAAGDTDGFFGLIRIQRDFP